MTTWQSNDDIRRNGGAEVAEFIDAPVPETEEPTRDDDGNDAEVNERSDGEECDGTRHSR